MLFDDIIESKSYAELLQLREDYENSKSSVVMEVIASINSRIQTLEIWELSHGYSN